MGLKIAAIVFAYWAILNPRNLAAKRRIDGVLVA
jgi:hypothetical protein